MITTKDLWNTLNPKERHEKISEALTTLKEIDTPKSKLKNKIDQGRLASVKKSLEAFVINAITWESDKLINKRY